MKTKKQLFKAAMKGPNLQYNISLQLLDVITDLRNCIITCKLEDEGEDIEVMKAEMKRVYKEEVKDD